MVDIVIVNWNSSNYLEKCIYSVFNTNNKNNVNRVFIIDNNSQDSSIDKIIHNDKVKIIRNEGNLGFSKACNQGIKLCSSGYVLLLNPDTQLLDTTLKDCMAFMQEKNDIDILGCQLLDDKGNITLSCSRFPTPKGIFFDSLGFSKIAPSIFRPSIIMSDWDHKKSCPVDQVMGAFMFMDSDIFEKVGYFDEQFFVYYEEVDFSKRLAKLGGKSYFNANIKAIHSGEGTTKTVKGFRLYLNLQSRLKYAKKHFSSGGYFMVWFATFFIEPFSRTILLLIKGNFKEIAEIFKGYTLLVKSLTQN